MWHSARVFDSLLQESSDDHPYGSHSHWTWTVTRPRIIPFARWQMCYPYLYIVKENKTCKVWSSHICELIRFRNLLVALYLSLGTKSGMSGHGTNGVQKGNDDGLSKFCLSKFCLPKWLSRYFFTKSMVFLTKNDCSLRDARCAANPSCARLWHGSNITPCGWLITIDIDQLAHL